MVNVYSEITIDKETRVYSVRKLKARRLEVATVFWSDILFQLSLTSSFPKIHALASTPHVIPVHFRNTAAMISSFLFLHTHPSTISRRRSPCVNIHIKQGDESFQ